MEPQSEGTTFLRCLLVTALLFAAGCAAEDPAVSDAVESSYACEITRYDEEAKAGNGVSDATEEKVAIALRGLKRACP